MVEVVIPGRCCGMPVTVKVLYDGEEYQCPACRIRFTARSFLVAHMMDKHRRLVKGGNLREEG